MRSSNEPLVSVVVLTYNQGATIGRTLDHILAQRVDFSYEVIIGEDASPSDNTRAVCEAYAEKYPDIVRLMPKAANKGLMRNYSDCLKECKGKYIAGCAGDDWWHNHDKLQLQISFLQNSSEYGVVHTNVDVFIEQKQITRPAEPRNPPQGEVYQELFKYCFVYAPTAMYRRDLLSYVEFEKLKQCGICIEDYPMWLEFAHHCKIGYIDTSTVTYSIIENSLSHLTTLEKRLKFIEQIFLVHKFYIERYPNESLSQREANIFYNRSIYMELLKFGEFGRARAMVGELGFPKLICAGLKIPLVGRLVWLILDSSVYRRIKKL